MLHSCSQWRSAIQNVYTSCECRNPAVLCSFEFCSSLIFALILKCTGHVLTVVAGMCDVCVCTSHCCTRPNSLCDVVQRHPARTILNSAAHFICQPPVCNEHCCDWVCVLPSRFSRLCDRSPNCCDLVATISKEVLC